MITAGVDEAGRGPLAGPVFAAAVILKPKEEIKGLNDSKKIPEKKREALIEEIKFHSITWSISASSVIEIDSMNILQASLLAMKRAIEGLEVLPELVLVDGIHAPLVNISTKTIIKGDQNERSIMAASILAKVSRDNYMRNLDTIYPRYGFKQHKGYPTKMHLEALNSNGITKEHRLSFKPIKSIHESNK